MLLVSLYMVNKGQRKINNLIFYNKLTHTITVGINYRGEMSKRKNDVVGIRTKDI